MFCCKALSTWLGPEVLHVADPFPSERTLAEKGHQTAEIRQGPASWFSRARGRKQLNNLLLCSKIEKAAGGSSLAPVLPYRRLDAS